FSMAIPFGANSAATDAGLECVADLRRSLKGNRDSTHITLIGDSITWGSGASDIGPTEPRSHSLEDTRDVLTSSSWANKFRRWAAGVACGQRNGSEPSPGESLHSHAVDVAPYLDAGFRVLDALGNQLEKNGRSGRNGPLLKSHLDIPAGVGNRCVFDFVGSGFTIYFASLTNDAWTVLVDGVEVASHVTLSGSAWQQTKAISGLDFGRHIVEVVNEASRDVRLEAIRFRKTIRFTNNGLNGTDTRLWLPGGPLLDEGVPVGATHLFIQLGTNDRAQAATDILPAGPERTAINLRQIVDWLRSNRPATLIALMAPPLAAIDEQSEGPPFMGSTDDLLREVSALATELNVSFIDNYTPCMMEQIDGSQFLADGLHPNDAGHRVVFRNIIEAIKRR
ncbi:MAG: SGNH/GDSL hydrolase family protein, partial [Roseovarius sp.]|nr:SGNH/GDSL hydrolase family protein [Roseovarius sp.]